MFEKEYETLRQELNENRKYVFERPLLIITAALVFFEYIAKTPFIMLFPNIIIFLLLFNLKFTSNRLNSSARIVSYIRLFIEKKDPSNYRWESFLSKYREDRNKKGLRYYPTIYWFHILTVLIFVLFEILLYLDHQIDSTFKDVKKEIITIFSIVFCFIGLVYLVKIGIETSPQKINDYFENEINNVKETLKDIDKESTPPNK
ncbi:MAG: hypothetical protein NTX93_11180 [Bacteroidia bacterium]|nr:hypothetical protein [Bacteroidia bacterium]